jgi:hypothetical protein
VLHAVNGQDLPLGGLFLEELANQEWIISSNQFVALSFSPKAPAQFTQKRRFRRSKPSDSRPKMRERSWCIFVNVILIYTRYRKPAVAGEYQFR